MARLGLGQRWRCVLANDWDNKKAAIYRSNFGRTSIVEKDIAEVSIDRGDGRVDLCWASFPCQDVSVAGNGKGLRGHNSGTFWPFWEKIQSLQKEGLEPTTLILENVCGLLSSNDGEDIALVCGALKEARYRFGAIILDTALFLPQSRKRMFLIAVREGVKIPSALTSSSPRLFHPDTLTRCYRHALDEFESDWIWWNPSPPKNSVPQLASLLSEAPTWHSASQTKRFIDLMSEETLERLEKRKEDGQPHIGTLYRRMRQGRDGRRIQRAEVRFDGLAGCLRAPTGGSSRQIVIEVCGGRVRTRHLTGREALNLMGVKKSYKVSGNDNENYRIAGEGVAVPVVRYLRRALIEPILSGEEN